MFIKKSSEDEILESMEKNLMSNVLEKVTEPFTKLDSAIDHINTAAEIFDEVGLVKEAEVITILLEKIAKKKAKKSKKSKKTDKSVKGLTSEKMVKNLKEKGWVFNADDANNAGHAVKKEHDPDCMCSYCMDGSTMQDKNHGDDCACANCDDANFAEDPEDKKIEKALSQLSEEDNDDWEDEENEGEEPSDEDWEDESTKEQERPYLGAHHPLEE